MTLLEENSYKCIRELCNYTEKLAQKIKKYINSFSQSDFFVFSDAEKRKNQYKSKYNRLSLELPTLVFDIESVFSKLAVLLIDADREENEELSTRLNALFFAHDAFEEALSEFFAISEKELSSNAPSPAALTSAAGRLTAALDALNFLQD